MDDSTERHEAIHVLQFLEIAVSLTIAVSALAFWGSIYIPAWLLALTIAWIWSPGVHPGVLVYSLIWMYRRVTLKESSVDAYENHPMEIEASIYETGRFRISDRPLFGWLI